MGLTRLQRGLAAVFSATAGASATVLSISAAATGSGFCGFEEQAATVNITNAPSIDLIMMALPYKFVLRILFHFRAQVNRLSYVAMRIR